jgi:signal transduction histidine kinase
LNSKDRRSRCDSRGTLSWSGAESIISLLERALDLTGSNRDLETELASQDIDQAALVSLGEEASRLLNESHQLQIHLRQLTHNAFVNGEEERRTVSLALQDQIVQALAGIGIRLLTLKNEVSDTSTAFNKEIATTRRMVQSLRARLTRCDRETPVPDEN